MKKFTIADAIGICFYGILLGFILSIIILKPTFYRQGQEKAMKGEWLIYADTIAKDTTIIKYRKLD